MESAVLVAALFSGYRDRNMSGFLRRKMILHQDVAQVCHLIVHLMGRRDRLDHLRSEPFPKAKPYTVNLRFELRQRHESVEGPVQRNEHDVAGAGPAGPDGLAGDENRGRPEVAEFHRIRAFRRVRPNSVEFGYEIWNY